MCTRLARVLAWMVVVSCIALLGCNPLDPFDDTSTPLPEKRGDEIPHTALVFAEVVAPDARTGGGWQAMCIHLTFKRHVDDVSEGRSPEFTCSVEFGFPVEPANRGRISSSEAARIAAKVLNRAVAELDTAGLTSTVCRRLVDESQRLVRKEVGLAKAEQCGKMGRGIPEVTWP